MNKGPKLNIIPIKFTPRDNLGIERVAVSMQSELCPIVSTITPKPYYWAFLTWCFYDYYNNFSPKDRKDINVYKYAKKQNYFFALANIIKNPNIVAGLTGSTPIKSRVNLENDLFTYDEDYLETTLGVMAYYTHGINALGFVTSKDPDTDEEFSYSKLTPTGEKLAKTFEEVICNTQYYKKRLTNDAFTKEELLELSDVVDINLNGFDKTKEILKDKLFNRKSNQELIESHNYIKMVYDKYNVRDFNPKTCREFLFDYFSLRSNNHKDYDVSLKKVIDNWEIVIGRQYFAAGLEMIWMFMMEQIGTLKTKEQWFLDSLNKSNFEFNLNNNLSSIIDNCNYEFDEREKMIADASNPKNNHLDNIQNGLKILLSIYNRFIDRQDFDEDTKNYLNYGIESNSISLNQFFDKVEEYKSRSIKDFLVFVMNNFLVEQHLLTVFEKMVTTGNDGYYIEKIENEYIIKKEFGFQLPELRLTQLASVMNDLDLLEVE